MQTKLAFLNFLLASAATGAFAAPTPTGLNLPDLYVYIRRRGPVLTVALARSVIAPPVVSTLPDSIFHLPSLDALSSRDAKFNDLSASVYSLSYPGSQC
ncbi:hypothetical protein BC834DRAFT_875486 [Gloeopeniophorella convolvens]|nr:hypothetical protein BC834DRAFT_875486 [Gloeopeniophorella convolvens]